MTENGRYALSGSHDRTLRLWEVASGRCVREMEAYYSVFSVFLNADGRYALSGGDDRTFFLWDMVISRMRRRFNEQCHPKGIRSVCLSSDGYYALSGSDDKTLRLWQVDTGFCQCIFNGHLDTIRSVCLSEDGRYALSGSVDQTLRLWAMPSTTSATDFPLILSHYINSSERMLAAETFRAALDHGIIALQEARWADAGDALKAARRLPGYTAHPEVLIRWAELGRKGARRIGMQAVYQKRVFEGHTAGVFSVCLSADGLYALSGSADKTLRLWEVATGRCLRIFSGHTDTILSVCLSADGLYALSGSSDKTLRLWEVATGCCQHIFEGHTDKITSICLSEDGLYALSGSADKTLRLWEVATGRCLRIFEGHTGAISSVCVSVDGHYALSQSDDETVRQWDVTNSRCMRIFESAHHVNAVPLMSDGRYELPSQTESELKHWVTTGSCVVKGQAAWLQRTRCMSADGRYVVLRSESLSKEYVVELREVASGRCLREWDAHTDYITSVCLSADGRYALSGSIDKTLQLWELDWEYVFPDPADWDDGALPYLQHFLTLHTPYAGTLPVDREPTEEEITLALTRSGTPTWTEEDFQRLLYTLGCAGYGWLRPEGVRRKLGEMAKKR